MRFSLAIIAAVAADAKFLESLRKKVPTAGSNAYDNAVAACCACFKLKFTWPGNGGTSSTFASKHTCDTCYVSDRFGVAGASKESKDIAASPKAASSKAEASAEPAYKVVTAKVEDIHEWNWNCAQGVAPEAAADWGNGPVAGEPAGDVAARGAYQLCKTDPGFYCKGAEQDMELVAGEDDPKWMEAVETSQDSVTMMTLPVLDL